MKLLSPQDMSLAIALLSLPNKQGDATDADEVSELLYSILDICSPVSLEHRSAYFSLLDDVISQYQNALFCIPGWSDWVDWQLSLATALALCFRCQGWKQDLEEAILSFRKVLIWTPRDCTSHCSALNNLAGDLCMHFEQGGDRRDLEEAIQYLQDTLVLTPPGHPFHARPPGHPDYAMSLNHIANVLLTQFKQGGGRKDPDGALQLCHIAQAESPPSHPFHIYIYSTILPTLTSSSIRPNTKNIFTVPCTLSMQQLPLHLATFCGA
ncbi:hypothetical protein PAXRUDRAFT_31773 [Paxillus rubicundulus Ve08.2h10]|uniref:Uncharacterized protein n=1 Tax=Paxillus rubicundulus Ve08.2h10 TaxID=930991 RepID=A0A0D0E185_9AGAM|nr:hypothetical protein PAXRUDRAFT_31773 [Paxillus rubicundulus Ve08.2h10]